MVGADLSAIAAQMRLAGCILLYTPRYASALSARRLATCRMGAHLQAHIRQIEVPSTAFQAPLPASRE